MCHTAGPIGNDTDFTVEGCISGNMENHAQEMFRMATGNET